MEAFEQSTEGNLVEELNAIEARIQELKTNLSFLEERRRLVLLKRQDSVADRNPALMTAIKESRPISFRYNIFKKHQSVVRAEEGFDLSVHLPSSYRSLVNTRGQVVFDFTRTIGYRILGEDLARKVIYFLSGTPLRITIYVSLIPITGVVGVLGLIDVLGKEVGILSGTILCMWILVTIVLTIDVGIYLKVCTSLANISTIVFAILGGVFFGLLSQWDYKGIVVFLVLLSSAIVEIGQDALPYNIRRIATVPVNITAILTLGALTGLVYLQAFPEFQYAFVLFTIPLRSEAGVSVEFSALSLFTQSISILLFLYMRNLMSVLIYRKRLTSAVIRLEGVDKEGTVGKPESFESLATILSWFTRLIYCTRP